MKFLRRTKTFIMVLLLTAVSVLLILRVSYEDKSVLLKAFDHVDNHSNTTTATKAPTTATKTTTTTTTSPPLPLIYLITPTVYRTEQKADLTRLSHTLRLVSRIHWIVVEDRPSRSLHVANFLANCKVPYTHLAVKTSYAEIARLKLMGHLKGTWVMPKGVEQRNLALEWITQNGEFPSVFYPLDDDNTYDLQIFEEMRYTKRVAVWPVGLVGRARFQSPVLKNGKVVAWATGWYPQRKFAIDMAGFAVNSQILKRPNPPRFSVVVGKGKVETDFLEQLNVTLAELEPKADNCSKVLVWHTRTSTSSLKYEDKLGRLLFKYNIKPLEV